METPISPAPDRPELTSPGPEEGSTQAPTTSTTPSVGRVLLLEDDDSFREAIHDFLTESGYTVIAVESGVAGIREVLAGDFVFVLCDMMMPGLSGEMFYRAVARIRPQLCERFAFMTGLRGDEKAHEFIKSVNGYGLRKPFHLDDLLATIRFLEVRGQFADSSTLSFLGASARASEIQQPAIETAHNEQRRSSTQPILAACVGLLLTGVLAGWYLQQRAHADALTAEVQQLDKEWAIASTKLEDARKALPQSESVIQNARRIFEEQENHLLTPVLRSIAASTGPQIELRTIHATEKPADSPACLLRIDGMAEGSAPRVTADRFLETLNGKVGRLLQVTLPPQFERLEDEPQPPGAPPHLPKAAFTITAETGLTVSEESEHRNP